MRCVFANDHFLVKYLYNGAAKWLPGTKVWGSQTTPIYIKKHAPEINPMRALTTKWSSIDYSEGSPLPDSNNLLASMERRGRTKNAQGTKSLSTSKIGQTTFHAW